MQQSLRGLDQALPHWWGRLKGSRQVKARTPPFRRRNNRPSMGLQSNASRAEGGKPRLTRVGGIPMAWSKREAAWRASGLAPWHPPGLEQAPACRPNSVTIIKDCAGRSGASFVVAVEQPQLKPNGNAVVLPRAWHPWPSPVTG